MLEEKKKAEKAASEKRELCKCGDIENMETC